MCLCFGMGKPMLDDFTDADMAGDVDSRKSTSGYLMIFAGGAVAWQFKLKKCIAYQLRKPSLLLLPKLAKKYYV